MRRAVCLGSAGQLLSCVTMGKCLDFSVPESSSAEWEILIRVIRMKRVGACVFLRFVLAIVSD